jgi:hypothetical protein
MLYSSHVFYPPVYPKHAIEPSIHPINRLLVELALRVVGIFRLFQVVLLYRGGKVITCSTLWIYVVGDNHVLL